mmetsp:Transcript_30148/g.45486  ORF Transcript_30148/g.45486 Transcript_30148/m.45486 type:complete len:402 (+) Transcript_30148:89-1294(+)
MTSFLDDTDRDLPHTRIDTSEVLDRMAVMRQQEEITYRCGDYLSMFHRKSKENNEVTHRTAVSRTSPTESCGYEKCDIDEECRVKMCEWCYQVVDFCKLRRETVEIAMSYLDRYLFSGVVLDSQPQKNITLEAFHDRKSFQLAAMTSLYIAIKLFEPVEMDVTALSRLSHGCYSASEIAEMECNIISVLGWRFHGPTSHSFVQHMVALLPSMQPNSDVLDFRISSPLVSTLLDCSIFQTELAIKDYFFVHQRSSTIAFSSIINALEGIEFEVFPSSERANFIGIISNVLNIDPRSPEILTVRVKLLEAFAEGSDEVISTDETSAQAASSTAAAVGSIHYDNEADETMSSMTDSPTSQPNRATATPASAAGGKSMAMDVDCDDSIDSSPICVASGNARACSL